MHEKDKIPRGVGGLIVASLTILIALGCPSPQAPINGRLDILVVLKNKSPDPFSITLEEDPDFSLSSINEYFASRVTEALRAVDFAENDELRYELCGGP